MDQASVSVSFFIEGVSGQVSFGTGNVAYFHPDSPLEYGTTYTVVVETNALAADGSPLVEPYTFTFTTAADPNPPVISVGGQLWYWIDDGDVTPGLTADGLVLSLNHGEQIVTPLTGETTFTFQDLLPDNTMVTVAIDQVPEGQQCGLTTDPSVLTAASTDEEEFSSSLTFQLAGVDISDILVVCAEQEYSVSGSISGLQGVGMFLRLTTPDGFIDQEIAPGMTHFDFMDELVDGDSYTLSVLTQPNHPPQTCTVTAGASGTIAGDDKSDAQVSCVTFPTYSVGGTVYVPNNPPGGFTSDLILEMKVYASDGSLVRTDFLHVMPPTLHVASTPQSFSFDHMPYDKQSYVVSVYANPTNGYGYTCMVYSGGSGTVNGSNVTSVEIHCFAAS